MNFNNNPVDLNNPPPLGVVEPGPKKKKKKIELPIVPIKNTSDYQRMKLERLMANPDKPVVIPSKPKDKKGIAAPPDFVRNIMGSSAGAGSGEFHVYRHLRRKEYARQKAITEQAELEQKEEDYKKKCEEKKKLAEEKTAKKRAKRLKQKAKMKQRQKQKGQGKQQQPNKSSSSSSSEAESDDKNEQIPLNQDVTESTIKVLQLDVEENNTSTCQNKPSDREESECVEIKGQES